MKKIVLSTLIVLSIFTFVIFSCKKKPTTTTTTPPCDYIQWTGTESCSGSGFYTACNTHCCPVGYPFTFDGSSKCYTSCEAAKTAANGAKIYRYNDGTTGGTTTGGTTTGGTTTGGTTTGGTTTGGGGCASMNSYISLVSVIYNNCSNNSGATFKFKNNSNQKLQVRVPIKLTNGSYSCQFATPNAGATFDVWTCNSTTTYGTITSMLYSDWIANCTFPSTCP